MDPDWIYNNGLLLSYCVKRIRNEPLAKNVNIVVERSHHVFLSLIHI